MYLIYDLAHVFFAVSFRPIFGYRVIGSGNVPKEGPVILASNHASYMDPPFVGTGIWRRVNFVARDTLFDRPWKRFILNSWRAMPVRREQLDKSVLKAILGRLKEGKVVGLFPEGTRSEDGELQPAKAGIGMIVSMADVPVVPVYIKGSHKTMSKRESKLRAVPISIVYGKPMRFPKVPGEPGHDRYQRIADEIMAAIAELKREHG